MLLFFTFILVFAAIIAVYLNTNYKRISGIGGLQSTDITKISFQYDNPSIKGGTVENKEKTQEFMQYINSCVIAKKWIQTPMAGYDQMAVFFISDKEVMRIMFYEDFIEINGIQYDMVKDKLSSEKIDSFIKSIK